MPDISAAPAKTRMTFPDGLRAIAALIVVFPHTVGVYAYWKDPNLVSSTMVKLSGYGTNGVQIFFVLSGFVIAYTLRHQWVTPRYFGVFVLRRSIRLDPPYWAAIVIFCGFLVLQGVLTHRPIAWPSGPKLLSHLFYLQNILGYGDINVVFWTLCIEIQLYLVFCFCLGIFQRLHRLTGYARAASPAVLFFVCFLVSMAWPAKIWATNWNWLWPNWYGFLAGVVVSEAMEKRLSARLAMLSFAVLALTAWHTSPSPLVAAMTAAVILLCAVRHRLYDWLSHPALQWIGRISYCLYLVHVPIAGIVLASQKRLAPHHQWTSFVFQAVDFTLSILLAYLLHIAVERPSLRWSQRLKQKASPSKLLPS